MKSSQAGFTYLELGIALVLVAVGVTAVGATFLSTTRLSEESRQTATMTATCRSVIETIRGSDFADVMQNFGPNSGQDSFWCDQNGEIVFTNPGNALASGTVQFFTNETAIPLSFADMGAGFDLNGNGVIDLTPVNDYEILPTRLTVSVSTPNGTRQLTFDYLLSRKDQ